MVLIFRCCWSLLYISYLATFIQEEFDGLFYFAAFKILRYSLTVRSTALPPPTIDIQKSIIAQLEFQRTPYS